MISNKKGSIFIWSIFLIVFMTMSFGYISFKIKANIESQKYFLESINKITDVKKEFNNTFTGNIRYKDTLEIDFLNSNTGSINIINGGPIFYKNNIGSGIIVDSKNDITMSGNLLLENIGGLANFEIILNNTSGIIFPYNYYYETTKIGNLDMVITTKLKKY